MDDMQSAVLSSPNTIHLPALGHHTGSCVDGWWLFINASDNDVTITKADANFGLRTLGDNPRDSARPVGDSD